MPSSVKKKIGRPVDPGLKAQRKAQILKAALRFFATYGYAKTDVQLLADDLGIGKGTIYRYFGNKEKLFLATADDAMQQLETYCMAALSQTKDTAQLIRKVGLAYLKFFQEHPLTVEILIQERAEFRGSIPDTHLFYRKKNQGLFEEILRNGIKSGDLRKVNVNDATTAYANLLYGPVVCGCLEGSSKYLLTNGRKSIDLFLNGILNHSHGKYNDT